MNSVGYIYFAKLADEKVIDFIEVLSTAGLKFSHLGKSDPPKKWNESKEAAAEVVVSGKESTRWTFGRDKENGINFTIELHADPRWTHHTFSITSKESEFLTKLISRISQKMNPFLSFTGISGKGKDQNWKILHSSNECPLELRNKIK